MENAEVVPIVIRVINECTKGNRFEYSKIVDNLQLISGVGTLVKSLSGVSGVEGDIIREENNEPLSEPVVLEDLQELGSRISILSKKSKETFGSLKYDTDDPDIAKISQSLALLTRFMLNTLNTQNAKNFDIFRQEYQRKSPLACVYSFITSIEQDSTNPIICAMNQDRFKTKATFEKWNIFIDVILSQFLFLEAFCCGLFSDENLHTADLLKQEIETVNCKIDQLRENYQKDSSYWQHVKNLVYETQDHNVHQGNIAKSEIIQEKLRTILTDDSFFVLVYDHCEQSHRHAYKFNDDQAVVSFNRGNCNVVVYRSRNWNDTSESDRTHIQKEVQSLEKNRFPWSNNYHEMLDFLSEVVIHNAGFLAMIRKDRDIAIRAVNCESGPGAYTTVRAGNDYQNSVFTFFAGFD